MLIPKLNNMNIMPKLNKIFLTLLALFVIAGSQITISQNVLGYTDTKGRYFAFRNGHPTQIEYLPILSYQYSNRGIAYVDNSSLLNFCDNDNQVNLEIVVKEFYKNTDYYLYYGVGDMIGMWDGVKKKTLGRISKYPYSVSDSIAAYHDLDGFYYVYWQGEETLLSQFPVYYMATGKNMLAFVDQSNFIQIFYHNTLTQIDNYIPASLKLGANIAAYVDSYRDLKIFYEGEVYNIYNLQNLICRNGEETTDISSYQESQRYCFGTLVDAQFNQLPIFLAGDNMVMFIDERNYLQVFYKGRLIEALTTRPKIYDVQDNIAWFIDLNNFLNVFYEGEVYTVENYTPGNIRADKDIVSYTDLNNRLIAFYKGKRYEISKDIIRMYELNNKGIIYSSVENIYQYYSFE